MAQIQIAPEQIPAAIAQYRAELAAIESVLDIKTEILRKYGLMQQAVNEDRYADAALLFIEVQAVEYSLTVRGLTEKKNQLTAVLAQLESPIVQGGPLPLRGFRPPRV